MIVENDKNFSKYRYLGLHNDVDIKIGIIDKNRKNSQNCLLFYRFWSIVFMQYEYVGVICPFFCVNNPLLSYDNMERRKGDFHEPEIYSS